MKTFNLLHFYVKRTMCFDCSSHTSKDAEKVAVAMTMKAISLGSSSQVFQFQSKHRLFSFMNFFSPKGITASARCDSRNICKTWRRPICMTVPPPFLFDGHTGFVFFFNVYWCIFFFEMTCSYIGARTKSCLQYNSWFEMASEI